MGFVPGTEAPPDYYPRFWELAVLLIDVAGLLAIGHLIKRKWSGSGDPVPFPVALMLWFAMFVIYLLAAGTFYNTATDTHKFTILMWCLILWIAPVWYYSVIVLNSLAIRSVDRIGPFSARIEDPSEFAAARKLALRGDIDGAVSMYRSYTEKQSHALFEAARLLKSEDRFIEAALMFEEIAERFAPITRVWAEAAYQLARLQENNLDEPRAAIVLLRQVIERASEVHFCELAASDLRRLSEQYPQYFEGDEDWEEAAAAREEAEPGEEVAAPDSQAGSAEAGDATGGAAPVPVAAAEDDEEDDDDIPVPPQDPFWDGRQVNPDLAPRPEGGAEEEDY